MNDEFHSMISMYFFDFAIVDKPLNIRLQSVVPVRGGEKTYRGRGGFFLFHFGFITAKAIIVNRRSEKKGKQRFPAVLPEMGTAQKLYLKHELRDSEG